MTKTKYLKDKTGKFAGSVGVGAAKTPTKAPKAPRVPAATVSGKGVVHTPVESASVAAIGYDPRDWRAEVVLHSNPDKVYAYRMSPEQYEALRTSESIGSYFARKVRNNPTYTYDPDTARCGSCGQFVAAEHTCAVEEKFGIGFDTALRTHLRHNHFPPIHEVFVPVAKEAIEKALEGDYDYVQTYPNGLRRPVRSTIEGLHLEDYLDSLTAADFDYDTDVEDDESVCATEGCDGDAATGDSYDGYCADCADRLDAEGHWTA